MTEAKISDTRGIALDILLEILEKGSYSHLVLNQALSKYQYLEKQDRSFITRIVEGTLEYLIQIDYIINEFSKTKVHKMKPVIRTILRMSVYQIIYMDRVPDSAACNEAVKLAAKRGFSGLKGFVNGVLRSVSRNKDGITFPDDSIRYSVPKWMIDMWRGQYPEDVVKKILTGFLKERPLAVRCNLDKGTKEEITELLENQNVKVRESEYSSSVLYLENYDYLDSLTAFQKGLIQVQDLSSSLAGDAAAPQKGDYVIDVCGAPGGKSLHIADMMKGSGMVEVRDISDYKVSLIEENITRAGFTNIHASVWDALEVSAEDIGKADIVIADLPCSGLGIIGKKPDIKYRMTQDKIDSLVELQRNILSVVCQYVKPGGTLVYSTCTVNVRENEENMAWFMDHYPFEAVNIEGRLGDKLQADTMKHGYIQLLPGIHPSDGFFIAVMRRNDGKN